MEGGEGKGLTILFGGDLILLLGSSMIFAKGFLAGVGLGGGTLAAGTGDLFLTTLRLGLGDLATTCFGTAALGDARSLRLKGGGMAFALFLGDGDRTGDGSACRRCGSGESGKPGFFDIGIGCF